MKSTNCPAILHLFPLCFCGVVVCFFFFACNLSFSLTLPGDEWMLCDCAEALGRRHSVGSDSDYKGFMRPTTQHLLHPSVDPAADKTKI